MLVDPRVVDRGDVLVTFAQLGSRREQQRVVAELRAGGGVREPTIDVDPVQGIADQLRPSARD